MSKTTLDLSTLSDIADGAHTVKVKAKADGYIDSEFSNEVSYLKEPSGYTGHLSIDKFFDLRIYGIDSDGNETKIIDNVKKATVSGYFKYRANVANISTVYYFSVSNSTNCTYEYSKVEEGALYYGRNWTITPSGEFTFDIAVS